MRTRLLTVYALVLAALALNLLVASEANAFLFTTPWITNGPLTTARYEHTATLLPNGKTLVAGG